MMMTIAAAATAQEPRTEASSPAAAVQASAPAPARESKAANKAADRALRRRVARALGRARTLDASRMLIFARGAVVTLSGDVKDAQQAAIAVAVAQSVPGVAEVRDQLRIRGQDW
ncbi:BON domain-containing protein [Burkholderia anthina]|uniref:BON domain-containing protein n=1 Tax=Burkholderia anthina TaxID=179879 RepID=UPI001CF15C83|nr:BON domain-containing protein [Burkholderia anthina]MCA8090905.1 BON domain-containing protein [Burkholderia anthina]